MLGLAGAWTHFCVHNLVDNILVNNVHLHLGVMFALSAWVVGRRGVDEFCLLGFPALNFEGRFAVRQKDSIHVRPGVAAG